MSSVPRQARDLSVVSTADLPTHLADATANDVSLRRFLFGLPGVDPVGIEQRAAGLATRSIKRASKLAAIDLAISMVDLTTLEGADTPGKVRNLSRKAMLPDPDYPETPRTAAICVYPDMVPTAVAELKGSGVKVASVATAFPSGRSSLEVKLADTKIAVDGGADEIDMVIDRGAFLAGRYGSVFDQIVAVKRACGERSAEGDLGDWRAGHVRQCAPRLLACLACRRGLHQDIHRKDLSSRHVARGSRHAASGQGLEGSRPESSER